MLRTFLTPRWLALFAVLMVIIVVFARLGLWQLSVARDEAALEAYELQAAMEPVDIDDLLTPHQSFPGEAALRPVTVSGEYAPEREFLVPDRLLEGERGYWVATPMLTDEAGAWILMVRGFVTDPAQVPAAPQGAVSVSGAITPGESPAPTRHLPEGQRGSVDLAALVNEWPGAAYNAFVFVDTESVDGAEVSQTGIERIPPPVVAGDVDWRNLGYALQWWVFAGFASFMYWRFLTEAHQGRGADAAGPAEDGSADPGPGGGDPLGPAPATDGAPAETSPGQGTSADGTPSRNSDSSSTRDQEGRHPQHV